MPNSVYILSHTSVYHSNGREVSVVGVYSSKEAAAMAAGSIKCDYGTFDSAISSMFEDCHVDNRSQPPNNGIILRVGDADLGQGDYEELTIREFPILGTEEVTRKIGSKRKASKKRKKPQNEDFGEVVF